MKIKIELNKHEREHIGDATVLFSLMTNDNTIQAFFLADPEYLGGLGGLTEEEIVGHVSFVASIIINSLITGAISEGNHLNEEQISAAVIKEITEKYGQLPDATIIKDGEIQK